nr:DUF805 domain-containing protein [Pseudomonas chlororaphis]
MQWYLKCLKQHYFDMKGRADRKEFWMFNLVNFLIACAIVAIAALLSTLISEKMALLASLYSLLVLLPSLAVTVRRLHDVGKSGWFLLFSLIPVLGALYVFYFLLKQSDADLNAYGEPPL